MLRKIATVVLAAVLVIGCQGATGPVGSSAQPSASCSVHGLLPDPSCTPGDVETTDLDVICHSSTKERRAVSSKVHRLSFAEYGIEYPQPTGSYEVDHLISLELGGSNDLKNLWPEAAPGFHRKDVVENFLHAEVCAGRMKLEDAQRQIAKDWTVYATH